MPLTEDKKQKDEWRMKDDESNTSDGNWGSPVSLQAALKLHL